MASFFETKDLNLLQDQMYMWVNHHARTNPITKETAAIGAALVDTLILENCKPLSLAIRNLFFSIMSLPCVLLRLQDPSKKDYLFSHSLGALQAGLIQIAKIPISLKMTPIKCVYQGYNCFRRPEEIQSIRKIFLNSQSYSTVFQNQLAAVQHVAYSYLKKHSEGSQKLRGSLAPFASFVDVLVLENLKAPVQMIESLAHAIFNLIGCLFSSHIEIFQNASMANCIVSLQSAYVQAVKTPIVICLSPLHWLHQTYQVISKECNLPHYWHFKDFSNNFD